MPYLLSNIDEIRPYVALCQQAPSIIQVYRLGCNVQTWGKNSILLLVACTGSNQSVRVLRYSEIKMQGNYCRNFEGDYTQRG